MSALLHGWGCILQTWKHRLNATAMTAVWVLEALRGINRRARYIHACIHKTKHMFIYIYYVIYINIYYIMHACIVVLCVLETMHVCMHKMLCVSKTKIPCVWETGGGGMCVYMNWAHICVIELRIFAFGANWCPAHEEHSTGAALAKDKV